MLQRLSIQNYALIDNIEIELDSHLNIITGETGAGKSILLGALSLILGQRIEGKYFFNQDKKCIIEGHFEICEYGLQSFFDANDIDYADISTLRREISIDGKSRAFINDTPVNLTTLKQLGQQLIDIHSQNATLEINDSDFQLLVIDTIADNKNALAEYKKAFNEHRQLSKRREHLQQHLQKMLDDQDYQQFQLQELEQAKLTRGEQDELEKEQEALSNAEQIKTSLNSALWNIEESENAALTLLKSANQSLNNIAAFSDEIEQQETRIQSVLIELKDISNELFRIQDRTTLNNERLEWVNERLSLIYQLLKKHKAQNIHELLEIQAELESLKGNNEEIQEEIHEIDTKINHLQGLLANLATQLHQKRENATSHIETSIKQLLNDMNMPDAVLTIEILHQGVGIEHLRIDGADQVRFLFSANKGAQVLPMNKVASGGELSRLMLAVKSIIAQKTALPTIIFDEIDTGISGEVALRVGNIMERLSSFMQVISITHLPQIASKGENHFFVYKQDDNNISKTRLKKLNQEERIKEIAVMLSGSSPNEYAIENAKQLLQGK